MVSLYYVLHCCIELLAPLGICTKHSTLHTAIYSAFLLHSMFSVGSRTNVT